MKFIERSMLGKTGVSVEYFGSRKRGEEDGEKKKKTYRSWFGNNNYMPYAITTLLGKEINLTKLDITYLYMIVFLCVQSISQKGGD